jgi:hypothetical protein
MENAAEEKKEQDKAADAANMLEHLRALERKMAASNRVSKTDFTLDSTGGDIDDFFQHLLSEWIGKALQKKHPLWKRETHLSKEDFELAPPDPTQGPGNLRLRPRKQEMLFFAMQARVPVDAVKEVPDYVAGIALLLAAGSGFEWLVKAPLVHARYWIAPGQWKLEGIEKEIKREAQQMLEQLEPKREEQEQEEPAPPPLPHATQQQEEKTVLVQDINIFVDASEAWNCAYMRVPQKPKPG